MSYSTIQVLQNTTLVFVNTNDGIPKRFELPDPQTCPGRILGFKGQGGATPFEIQTTTSTLSHTIPYEARLLINDGQSNWHTLTSYTGGLEANWTTLPSPSQATEIPAAATLVEVNLRSNSKTLQLPLTPQEGRILLLKDSHGACQGESTLTLLTQTSSLTFSNAPFISMILANDSSNQWNILQKSTGLSTLAADLSGSLALSLPNQACCVHVEPSTVTKTLCLPSADSANAGDLFCIVGESYILSTLATNTLDRMSTPQICSGPLVLTPDGVQNWMVLAHSSL